MIKDILQQLAPLDEKIAALRGDPADENMTDITNHAAELAELSAQEDALLSGCGALTAEDINRSNCARSSFVGKAK